MAAFWFGAGLFFCGTFMGALVIALCVSASRAEEEWKKYE